ncbi:6-bladed beta-propeller [Rhodothermus profundi]|uniref:NHL repeat-containing protein n=1 Tax=Rhodothermus profundi TaxID=633813 RepID=A0A1M6QI12_9BACT|nr:6-bladed beta-propeller [Rhodothermus profundi]SHK19836.1 hypothetical protein SAMN04488087_0630 [Rhodothermus profundi]
MQAFAGSYLHAAIGLLAGVAYLLPVDRIYRSVQWELLWEVGEPVLLNPVQVEIGPGGRVYVMDYGTFRLHVFTPDGQLHRTIGQGEGQGPGEFSHPIDFVIDARGRIWVLDATTARVTIFSTSGSLDTLWTLPFPASRLALSPDSRHYALFPISPRREGAFALFRDGQLLGFFGQLAADQVQRWIAFDGRLMGDREGFYYTAIRAGWVASFDWNGRVRFSWTSIEPVPFPQPERTPEGGLRLTRRHRFVSYDIAPGPHPETFAVMGLLPVDGRYRAVIDVYHRQDGRYCYSLQLPRGGSGFTFHGNRLYLVNRIALLAYRLEGNTACPPAK